MTFVIGSNNCAWICPETVLDFDLAVGATGYIARCEDVFNRCRLTTQNGVILFDLRNHNLFTSIQQVAVLGNESKQANWESGLDSLCVADDHRNS